jgi:hypothetical protein
MTTRFAGTVLALWVAASTAGCASPPTERVDAARARVEALATDAATYAPDTLEQARQAVARLDAELAAQEGSFFKSYGRTEELVTAVETAATTLEQAIDTGRTRLSAETDRAVEEAGRAVADARTALDALPPAAVATERASGWRDDLSTADTAIEQARQLRADGQMAEAQSQARQAREAAARVSAGIGEVEAEREAARQEAAARVADGDATLPRAVVADGQRLAAGTYRLRLGDEVPAPAGDIRPGRWVEFVSAGTVAGRALAVVVPEAEIREIATASYPRNEAWVAELRGGEYVRVWLHRGGMHYLIHLPTS